MNNTIVRALALPMLSAGVLGGAALGLAGAAHAAEDMPQPGPSMIARPLVHAQPAPEAAPGSLWHRHHGTLHDPQTAAELPHLAH